MFLKRNPYLLQTKLMQSDKLDTILSEYKYMVRKTFETFLSSESEQDGTKQTHAIGVVYTNHMCSGFIVTEIYNSIQAAISYAYAILQNIIERVSDKDTGTINMNWTLCTTLAFCRKNRFDEFDMPVLFVPSLDACINTIIKSGKSKDTQMRFIVIEYTHRLHIQPFLVDKDEIMKQNNLRGYIMQCSMSRPLLCI